MIVATVTAIAIAQREARREKQKREEERAAAAKKNVIIVGGGLCGLLTAVCARHHGFTVTLVETDGEDDREGEPGVITLAPNAVRLLGRWLNEEDMKLLAETACAAEVQEWRSAKSGHTVDKVSLVPRKKKAKQGKDKMAANLPSFEKKDDAAATLSLSWADFRDLCISWARNASARVFFNTTVHSFHDAPEELDGPLPEGRPYILTTANQKVYADMIVVADGILSKGRDHVLASLGAEAPSVPTGFSSYLGFCSGNSLRSDESTKWLVENDNSRIWIGSDRYLQAWALAGGEEWMYELVRPDSVDEAETEDYDMDGEIDDVEALLTDWDTSFRTAVRKGTNRLPVRKPRLPSATEKSSDVLDRQLCIRPFLPSVVSKKCRKLLVIGDAAHPFPPLSNQGLAQAIEDAACLCVCLKKTAAVPLGLEVYSRLRKPRLEPILQNAVDHVNKLKSKIEKGEAWTVEDCKLDEEQFWAFDAEKDAERFDEVIEQLTQELLEKQKAMLLQQARAEAEAKARAEAEAQAKAQAEEEANGQEDGTGAGTEGEGGERRRKHKHKHKRRKDGEDADGGGQPERVTSGATPKSNDTKEQKDANPAGDSVEEENGEASNG